MYGGRPLVQRTRPLEVRPKFDDALLCEYQQEVTVGDCVHAVAEIVQSKQILYASRVRGGQVCIFLSNMELVKKIADRLGYQRNKSASEKVYQ